MPPPPPRGSSLPWVLGGLGAVAIVIAAGFLLGTRPNAPSDDDWRAFTDPSTGLQVELPGDPVTERESIGAPGGTSIDVVIHMVEGWDAAWLFGVYLLDGHPFNLSMALAGGVNSMNGDLVSSTQTTVGAHRAIDAEVNFVEDRREGVAFMRLVLLEDRDEAVILQSLGLRSDREMVLSTFDRLAGSFRP